MALPIVFRALREQREQRERARRADDQIARELETCPALRRVLADEVEGGDADRRAATDRRAASFDPMLHVDNETARLRAEADMIFWQMLHRAGVHGAGVKAEELRRRLPIEGVAWDDNYRGEGLS